MSNPTVKIALLGAADDQICDRIYGSRQTSANMATRASKRTSRTRLLPVLGVLVIACFSAAGAAIADLPTAPVAFPFALDPSTTFRYEFHIEEFRSYIFSLNFEYLDRNDHTRLLNLLEYPGIPLLLRLRLVSISPDAVARPVYDATIVTNKI
jgi:hypothetical protein